MSDVLNERQVNEIDVAMGHKPFFGSLIATIRDRDRKINELDHALQDAWESKRLMSEQWLDHDATVKRLSQKLSDRDKTIAELAGTYEAQYGAANQLLQQQNTIMVEALERISEYLSTSMDDWKHDCVAMEEIAREALAKVQANPREQTEGTEGSG